MKNISCYVDITTAKFHTFPHHSAKLWRLCQWTVYGHRLKSRFNWSDGGNLSRKTLESTVVSWPHCHTDTRGRLVTDVTRHSVQWFLVPITTLEGTPTCAPQQLVLWSSGQWDNMINSYSLNGKTGEEQYFRQNPEQSCQWFYLITFHDLELNQQ